MSVETVGFGEVLFAPADPSPLQELSRSMQATSKLKRKIDERRFIRFCASDIDLYIRQALSADGTVKNFMYLYSSIK